MNRYSIILLIGALLYFSACKEPIVEEAPTTTSVIAEDLTQYGIANNPNNVLGGLQVGDRAPDFAMLSQDGVSVSLKSELQKGPVLLVFLRAEWCSFCVSILLSAFTCSRS